MRCSGPPRRLLMNVPNGSLNVHLSPTDLRYASRVLKQTGSAARAGLFERILIVGKSGAGT